MTSMASAAPLAHSRVGHGPPVLLVHCMGGDRNEWRDVSARLQKTHTVIAVDLPGFGQSPALPQPTLDGVADLLADVLRAEHAAPAIVVGHSLGGAISAHLAARHPELVRGLVVVDMMINTAFGVDELAQLRQGLASDRQKTLNGWFGEMMMPGDMERLAPSLDKSSNATLLGYAEALLHGGLSDGGKALTMPTLLMTTPMLLPGKKPRAEELAALGYGAAPRLTAELFTKSKHWIMWNEPARFDSVLEAFMARAER